MAELTVRHILISNELDINTLENAIYMAMKNDVSCVLDLQMNLYEHQSTVNPNMPLRYLMYVGTLYEKMVVQRDIYARKQILLPPPKFIVLYQGDEPQPERKTFRLSDTFMTNTGEINLELTVLQLNINKGMNQKLKENCKPLSEYTQYVERVKGYLQKMSPGEAVEQAVTECINENILRNFLKNNRAEVITGTDYANLQCVEEQDITFNEDGTISGDYTGSWVQSAGTPYVTLTINSVIYKGVFLEQNIEGTDCPTLCFTVVGNNDIAIWGYQELDAQTAIAKNVAAFSPAITDKTYGDLALTTEATEGVTVTWSSSDEAVISADGKVTPKDADTRVTLTTKFSKGDYYYEKAYETTVVKSEETDTESNMEAMYSFEGELVNKLNAAQTGEALAQASGTKPGYEYNVKRGSLVLHQYFGYNDASNISYARFDNPLKGKNLEQGATVSLWVNRLDTDVWDAIWSFYDTDNSDGVDGRVYLTPNAYLGFNGTGGWFDCNHPDKGTTNAIAVNDWNLVTVTFDKDGFTIYVNGQEKYSETNYLGWGQDTGNTYTYGQNVLNLLSSSKDFYLGYGSWWGSSPLLMDNLKIYSRALGESDVAALYSEEQKEVEDAIASNVVDTSDYDFYQDFNLTENAADVAAGMHSRHSLLFQQRIIQGRMLR